MPRGLLGTNATLVADINLILQLVLIVVLLVNAVPERKTCFSQYILPLFCVEYSMPQPARQHSVDLREPLPMMRLECIPVETVYPLDLNAVFDLVTGGVVDVVPRHGHALFHYSTMWFPN